MKFNSLNCLWLLLVGSVNAQHLVGIVVDPGEGAIGTSVRVTVNFKSLGVKDGACGLSINFGDGITQQIRAEENNLPVVVNHRYERPGSFVVNAEGKAIFRGLTSVLGCLGSKQVATLAIRPDDYAVKQAEDRAAKESALKRAEEDRIAADLAAKRAADDRAAAERARGQASRDRAAAEKSARDAAAANRPSSRANPAAAPESPPKPSAETKPAPVQPAKSTPVQPAKPPPAKANSSFEL